MRYNSLLCEIDLRGAEWVVTAYFSTDARMIEVVEAKRDPHLRTGSLISGAPESFVKTEDELIGHLSDPIDIAEIRKESYTKEVLEAIFFPRSMSIRQAGKKSNHGLNYNMQYRRFALENEMEEAEAKKLVERYHHAYPGLRLMYQAVERQLNIDRTLTNCFGRKRRFLDRWSQDMLNSAYAQIPQSTVVDVLNQGYVAIFEDDDLDLEPRAQVHDSCVLCIPLVSWEDMAHIVARCRKHLAIPCEYHGRSFTLDTEVKIGANWGEAAMRKIPDPVTAEALEEAWERSLGAASM